MEDLYNSLSPGGVSQEPAVAPEAQQAQAEQLILAAADIAAIRELKEKGKIAAIGEYVSKLV